MFGSGWQRIKKRRFFLFTVFLLLLVIRYIEAKTPNVHYAETFYRYGLSCQRKDDFFKALDYYHKALDHHPLQAKSYFSIGELYYLLSDHDKAVKFLRRSTQLDPLIDRAFYILATINYKKGKYDRAISDLWRGIQHRRYTYPITYYYLLGMCYLEKNNFEYAKICADRIKKFTRAYRLSEHLSAQIEEKNAENQPVSTPY